MKRFLSPVQSGYFFIFLFFAALLTLIDGSFASLSIYQLSICLSTSSRKIIMFAASKHMDIYLSIALPMVSCTMSPLDLNNNFIKTTYDISLDSQISFLPLGFSPTSKTDYMEGLWLSLNVLSFQTSLETWTTAAIINWTTKTQEHQPLALNFITDPPKVNRIMKL